MHYSHVNAVEIVVRSNLTSKKTSTLLTTFSFVLTLLSRHLLTCPPRIYRVRGRWEYQWRDAQQEQQRQPRESLRLWDVIWSAEFDREADDDEPDGRKTETLFFHEATQHNHVTFYTSHRRPQSGGWCVKHSMSSACERECAAAWFSSFFF